jgi:molybdopterin/thiamine biosynthesis adenylyltransferase/rhodanese-related sulfurtransferase
LNAPHITALDLNNRLSRESDLVVVDVRTATEVAEGYIRGAIHLPLHELETRARTVLANPNAPIILYCAHGIRSAQALLLLKQLGYEQLLHLQLGIAHWQALGLPVQVPDCGTCASVAKDRYSRQILLSEIGAAGQTRLKRARVLLIGVGGLGSPAAMYLAGAGVGTLGLVDPDDVELSNLHRQIIHDTDRVGMRKTESARVRIESFNPDVKVEAFPLRFNNESADRILADGWDVIIDGADNFPTRYALNDVAVKRRIPVCHGSIDRFEGRVTTFLGDRGPCYRCLFPTQPNPGVFGACIERGVLGVLPGVIGTLQATEALKLLLGIGQPLTGRLLTYEALELEFRIIRYERNPTCSVCSTRVERS